MSPDDIRRLIGKLTVEDRTASFDDFAKVMREANQIRQRAFLKDLVALMHLYGIYWHLGGGNISPERLGFLNFEVGIEADGDVCSDTAGDLTKESTNYNDVFIIPVNPPTAHQKMEQAAHAAKLLADYLTGPGGGDSAEGGAQ